MDRAPSVRAFGATGSLVNEGRGDQTFEVLTSTYADGAVLQVQSRRGSAFDTAVPAWRSRGRYESGFDSTWVDVFLRGGWAGCVRAREHVPGQGWSAWSRTECIARAVDDADVVRRGPVRRVDARWFEDGRGTVLADGASLVLRGLPAGTVAGVLARERRDARYPLWSVGEGPLARTWPHGDSGFGLAWRARGTATGGVLRVTSRAPSHVVGGLVVLPPWVL